MKSRAIAQELGKAGGVSVCAGGVRLWPTKRRQTHARRDMHAESHGGPYSRGKPKKKRGEKGEFFQIRFKHFIF